MLRQQLNAAGEGKFFSGGDLEINVVLRYGNWMIEGRSGLSGEACMLTGKHVLVRRLKSKDS